MNGIYNNILLVIGIIICLLIWHACCAYWGTHEPTKVIRKAHVVSVGTPVVDKDAIDVLVSLGYRKTEAMQRVMEVFMPGTSTQDTVKKALQVK